MKTETRKRIVKDYYDADKMSDAEFIEWVNRMLDKPKNFLNK